MKIVIDIPEETVNEIKDNVMFADNISSDIRWGITSAIVNGTPLPKEHGRLIDETKIKNCGWNFIDHHAKTDAPTIIEEESEDK